MQTITLTVDRDTVWTEVAKISSYTGDKMTDEDAGAYERMLMTDEDQRSLQRFWEESAAYANERLNEMLETASAPSEDYEVTLSVPLSYDTVLNASVQSALSGYFISAIVGRWYRLCNKTEAESYMAESAAKMDNVLSKLYSRKRPRRAAEANLARRLSTNSVPETDCCCDNGIIRRRGRGQKVINKLVFLREELLLDIENYTFVTGDLMPTEDEHLKHQVFDVAQDGNEDLATRVLNLAHAECVESLYPYTKTPCIQDEELDDELVVPERYEIGLELPEEFSRTTVLLLRELIHDYFVCRVLVVWMGITCPGAQPIWKERLEILIVRMKRALLGRRKPLRRGQSMF